MQRIKIMKNIKFYPTIWQTIPFSLDMVDIWKRKTKKKTTKKTTKKATKKATRRATKKAPDESKPFDTHYL